MPAGSGDRLLDSALRRSEWLVDAARPLSLGLAELGNLVLPPSAHGRIDQAQLRIAASLYLAAELESARVIPAAEQLAGLFRQGSLPVNIGGADGLVAAFWNERNERASEDERRSLFSRLFDATFEAQMLDLCEALYKLDEMATNETYGGLSQQTRVRSSAIRLLETMVESGGGVTRFLAEDITKSLKAALAILGHQDLRMALRARDVWGAIAAIDRMAHRRRSDPRLFVRRGRAGMTVLSWLADAAPHVENQSAVLVSLDHPVIPAALDWMEAALAIGEAENGSAARPAGASAPSLAA